jgi:hypothetical protein
MFSGRRDGICDYSFLLKALPSPLLRYRAKDGYAVLDFSNSKPMVLSSSPPSLPPLHVFLTVSRESGAEGGHRNDLARPRQKLGSMLVSGDLGGYFREWNRIILTLSDEHNAFLRTVNAFVNLVTTNLHALNWNPKTLRKSSSSALAAAATPDGESDVVMAPLISLFGLSRWRDTLYFRNQVLSK